MKYTGYIRAVDSMGRIVLPVELRRSLDIQTGEELEILVDNGKIILRKSSPECVFCGSKEDLRAFVDKYICRECIRKII